mmetsp:Transcript_15330/g.25252  ORF Transcript_15330/g.25252 Transcript_15330/m.25252 type:complete len:89 (-) Transcript_15330:1085-1351(-)
MMIARYTAFFSGHVPIQTKWLHRSEEKSYFKLDQARPDAAKACIPAIDSPLKTTRLGATAFSVVIELHEKPQNFAGRSGSSSSSDLLT